MKKLIAEDFSRKVISREPYSEAKRFYIEGNFQRYEVADRINQITGVYRIAYIPAKPVGWKRQKMPQGYYYKLSMKILGEITGIPWLGFSYPKSGRLDERHEWILVRILGISRKQHPERKFLEAIAKDAGVWPAPKWWLVTRRLQGANRSFK